jgi:hypothetical protein
VFIKSWADSHTNLPAGKVVRASGCGSYTRATTRRLPFNKAIMTRDKPKKPTLHLLGDGKGRAITAEDIAVLYERLTGRKMSAEEMAYGREKLNNKPG